MSNWRDRTERDAMVRGNAAYQKPTETPKSTVISNLLKGNVLFPFILFIMALTTTLNVVADLIYTTLKGGTVVSITTAGSANGVNREPVKIICEKDSEGAFVAYTTNVDGGNKRPFLKWDSEDRCKETSTRINEQIKADQEDKSKTSQVSSEGKQISPGQVVFNHYRLIQDKQLDESWDDLSTSFQGASSSKESNKKEYKAWWNSVEKVNISSIEIVEESKTHAVVKVDIIYLWRGGEKIHHSKQYISLIWNNKRWLIDNKSASYASKS